MAALSTVSLRIDRLCIEVSFKLKMGVNWLKQRFTNKFRDFHHQFIDDSNLKSKSKIIDEMYSLIYGNFYKHITN